ncbi:MAG: AzlC family ABC transporter permease [Deltaproteobacteria bacterium]|nr:AzlC family ABC transporter permease [Deltaproteobacteria bacterium]
MRSPTRVRRPSLAGIVQAIPIVLGYLPAAFAFGVLAGEAGLSLLTATCMSLFVFAGASQYIALALLQGGQPIGAIIVTTCIVNLRHLLMSAAMVPLLRQWPARQRILFALQMTDETFALHSTTLRTEPAHAPKVFGVNLVSHAAWIGGSMIGFSAGALLGDVRSLGFDFALPAMFIALLVSQIRSLDLLFTALNAGMIAVALDRAGWKTSGVMIATIIAAFIGMAGTLWNRPKRSS